jgi:hypothetical protein
VIIVLLFFQEVGFPLQRQADALNTGGGEANDYSELQERSLALDTPGGMVPCILTATLAPAESSPMLLCRLLSLRCAYCYLGVGRMLCVCGYGCGNVYLAVTSSAGVGVAKRHAESVKFTRRLGRPSRGGRRDQPTGDFVGESQ